MLLRLRFSSRSLSSFRRPLFKPCAAPLVCRRFSSIPPTPEHPVPEPPPQQPTTHAQSQPPFIIRTLLVGSTVGLLTPVFATGGFVYAWFKFLPRHDWGVFLKYLLGACVGGGIATLCYRWVIPFMWNHGDVVLPFAVANAITSSAWYMACEYMVGLKAMQGVFNPAWLEMLPEAFSRFLTGPFGGKLPIGGLFVGVGTSLTSVLLWPLVVKFCWSEESQVIYLGADKSAWFLVDLFFEGGFLVSLPVGLFAGLGLHYLLAPLLTGTVARGSLPWTRTAGVALAGVTTSAALYFGLSQPSPNDFYWITRYDPKTGATYSWNTRTHASSATPVKGVEADNRRAVRNVFHFIRHPVKYFFGDQVARENLVLGADPVPKVIAPLPTYLGSLEGLDDYRDTYQLIDHLLRLKQLQLVESQTGVDQTSQKEHVNELCQERFGLNPTLLLEDVCSVVACREALAEASKDSKQDQIAYLQDLLARAQSQASRATKRPNGLPIKISFAAERANKLIEILLLNNELFETEHIAKLGIRIPAQAYVKRVEVARRREKTNNVLWNLAAVGAVLSLAGAVVLYVSKPAN